MDYVTRFTFLERVSDYALEALGITLRLVGWKNRQPRFKKSGIRFF
jgi:hypothetical protein